MDVIHSVLENLPSSLTPVEKLGLKLIQLQGRGGGGGE